MEILKLEYEATGPSIRASVPAMQDGVRMLGLTDPETTITLADLRDERPDLAKRLVELLADLEPFVRDHATRPISDPSAVQAQANANARERESLRLANEESAKLARDAAEAKALAEEDAAKARAKANAAAAAAAKSESDRIASESDHAALMTQIEAKRAELAELDAVPETETKEK